MRPLPLTCALLLSASLFGQSSTGTEFWVTFMENLTLDFNGPPTFVLVISSEEGATGAIDVPATGFSIPFTVPAGEDAVVQLPPNNYYAEGDEEYFDFGLRVTTDNAVSVYAYHDRLYFSEASLVLPTTSLGHDHLVLAHEDSWEQSPSEFVVLATEAATEVEITPSILTLGFRPPGVPFTVTLDQGQTIQMQAFGDLSGSRVRSLDPSKRLAVFAGAREARVGNPNCGANDHLYNQVYPLDLFGRDFFVVPFKNRGGDEVRIIAGLDGSQVTIGANTFELAPGEVASVFASGPTRIQSTEPIAVGQFNESQDCNGGAVGDPSYVHLPAITLLDGRYLWNSRTGAGTPEHYVNVVIPAGSAVGEILLDGVDISDQFDPVPGQTGWWYAQVTIAEGSHELISDKKFQAVAYGMGDYNSYSYALGFENTITTGLGELPSAQGPGDLMLDNASPWMMGPDLHGTEQLRIVDTGGREVLRTSVRSGSRVELATLPEGIYFYTRWSEDQRTAFGRLLLH